jgi:hypothetical protein
MSGVTIHGKVPAPRTILATLDEHAKIALRDTATRVVLPIAREEAPGGLGAALTSTVRRTETGYRATIQASPRKAYKGGRATGAQVVRYVTRGTGLYREGPGPKKKITSRRGVLGTMILPGGRRVRTVRGQHSNPFVARAEERARQPVRHSLEQGARAAGEHLRRLQ